MQYPCYMYHLEHGAKLFKDASEFEAAGEGWVDSPAKLEEGAKVGDFLSIDDLKVDELKKVLKEKYGKEDEDFKGLLKEDLKSLLAKLEEGAKVGE